MAKTRNKSRLARGGFNTPPRGRLRMSLADIELMRLFREPREVPVRTNAEMLNDASFFNDSLSARQLDDLIRQGKPVVTNDEGEPLLYR